MTAGAQSTRRKLSLLQLASELDNGSCCIMRTEGEPDTEITECAGEAALAQVSG